MTAPSILHSFNGAVASQQETARPQVTGTIETITLEVAREYLGHNTHNRKVRKQKVLAYASDMASGRWVMNGASIAFGEDGELIDGQHRLLAIIEANTPVQMLVVRGLSKTAQNTIDTGISRKLSDVLTLRGEINTNVLAAAIRSVLVWQKGLRQFGPASGHHSTMSELLQCFEDNQWIREMAAFIERISRSAKLPVSAAGALVYAFAEIDAEDAQFFWERLTSELEHSKGDPIYTLRRALHASSEKGGTRNPTYLAAITIKAWNKYRKGETCDMLVYRPGGKNAEKFPVPL